MRSLIYGVGAAAAMGVAGVATMTGPNPQVQPFAGSGALKATENFDVVMELPADTADTESSGDLAFCLPELIEGQDGCLPKRDLFAMDDRPVDRVTADGQPRPRQLTMVHPTDFSLPEERVETCGAFSRLRSEGWGPMTSADMADEGFFLRYCGLLALAQRASVARTSAFDPLALTEAEIRAIPEGDWPVFGEDRRAGSPAIRQDTENARLWHVETPTLDMRFYDVAHADFDDDGVGERLGFIAARARGGSAGFVNYVLLEHTSDTVRLRRVNFK